jgi:hypothetical protein
MESLAPLIYASSTNKEGAKYMESATEQKPAVWYLCPQLLYPVRLDSLQILPLHASLVAC